MVKTTKIALAHGEVRVCTQGPTDGQVILWVHGASYPLEVFSGLTEPLLQQGFRCIRFDLYGRGFSDWDGTPLKAEVFAEQALEVLRHFKVASKIHLVSLSNADLLVNLIASRIPSQVESITWIAPSGIDRRTMNPWARAAGKIPGIETLISKYMKHYLIRRMRSHRENLIPEKAPLSSAIYDLAIQSLSENAVCAAAATNQLKNLASKGDIEITAVAVAAARIPVMMLTFGDEKDTRKEDLEVFGQHIAATEIHLEHGSHMALLEDPLAIVPHLLQFLSA